jgi:bifunctional lysine-specific demethylase and histidyl-hydroxylase NO66
MSVDVGAVPDAPARAGGGAVPGGGGWRWLSRCVNDPELFLSEHWSRRPCVQRGFPERFADIFSVDEFDRIMALGGVQSDRIYFIKDGTSMPRKAFTSVRHAAYGDETVVDCRRASELLKMGGTILVNGIDQASPGIFDLCSGLERELSYHVMAHALLTPPQSQGLSVHRDPQDAIIIQISGEKQWMLYENPPDAHAPGGNATLEPGQKPALDPVLKQGDSLYVPRGTPHAAKATGQASLHVTLTVEQPSLLDLARYALEVAAIREPLERTLPRGFADDVTPVAGALDELPRVLAEALADPRVSRGAAEGFARAWRQAGLRDRAGRIAGTVRRFDGQG